ncbi:MAG: toprim domain-containing protein [Candidatus Aenigmarchaeota archaeon]
MRNKQRIDEEKLERVLRELEDKLTIVEGKNDKKALKSLGVKNIIAINGKPLYEVAEIVSKSKREIVILTDFDKKGREIEKRLKNLLQRHKKHPNSRLRGKIMSLRKNKIEDFGNLDNPNPHSFKEVDVYVKISADFNKIRDKGGNRCKRSNRET